MREGSDGHADRPANVRSGRRHRRDAMRFPPKDPGPPFQPNGRVEAYRLLQRRIGATRNVIVTPAAYVDNPQTLYGFPKI